jgi:acetyl esterase/lipase
MDAEDILSLVPPAADKRLAYGHDPNQFVDLRLPKGKSSGRCLVNIHGGFWRAKYDLAHAGHICADLATRGWLTVNVEYRRVGNEGGGWPASFSDLRSAVDLILGSAKTWHFEPEKLVVMGHSAGGQLALAMAAHDHRIKKAVSLAGVLDLKKAYELHLSNDAVVEFLGGTPELMADHFAEASPSQLHIEAQQLVVHGTQDDVVPFAISETYVRLKKAKERITPLWLEGAGHFDVIDPRTKVWKKIVAAL